VGHYFLSNPRIIKDNGYTST